MLQVLLIGLIFLSFIILIPLIFKVKTMHEGLLLLLTKNSQKLNQRSQRLKRLEYQLSKHPKELNRGEQEHVIREINKISNLWKSRGERLRMGLWENIRKEPEEEEQGVEVKEGDELSALNHQKERIKNLMNKTKIEYRKRKIDEVSFREIMRDYQKELMEVDVKISELENL